MASVTCGLTDEDQDQLWNPKLVLFYLAGIINPESVFFGGINNGKLLRKCIVSVENLRQSSRTTSPGIQQYSVFLAFFQ